MSKDERVTTSEFKLRSTLFALQTVCLKLYIVRYRDSLVEEIFMTSLSDYNSFIFI